MKRKILSLFLALSMALTCAVFTIPASAEEEAMVVEFSDNFDTETDTVPDKWSIVKSKDGESTLTVMEDNGNKFLRYFTGSAGDVDGQRVGMSTNDSLVNIPLSGTQDIVFKYRIRLSDVNYRSSSHLGGSADACIENNYRINWFRDGKIRVNSGTNTTTLDSPLTQTNVWYNITAKINPNTKAIAYTIVDESDNVSYTASGTLGSIESIICVVFSSNNATGHNIDIDDVSVGYYRAPIVRSFENTFESESVGSAPADWEDRHAVSTLTVMQETVDGSTNNYVRISKSATSSASQPIVALKDEKINMPLKEENKKGVVIEAKIRKPSEDGYRSMLMINPPKNLTTVDQYALGQNRYTLFYLHNTTNLGINALTSWTDQGTYGIAGGFENKGNYSINKWVSYKAIYIPDSGKLIHYINSQYASASTINLPSTITEMDTLSALAFTWRDAGTGEGTMDFDDVKIYELSNEPEVAVKYSRTELISGAITSTVTVRNGENSNKDLTFMNVIVVYDKDENGNLTLSEVKNGDVTELNLSKNTGTVLPWATVTKGSGDVNVTDVNNQVVKTFVWEANTLKPLCEPEMYGAVD